MNFSEWIVRHLFGNSVKSLRRTRTTGRTHYRSERLEARIQLSYSLHVLADLNSKGDPFAESQTPESGLVADSSGNLFGTTFDGGFYTEGTLFEWVKSTGAISILVNFNGSGASGGNPQGHLTEDGSGNLFGTTFDGGRFGDGTVFEEALKPTATETSSSAPITHHIAKHTMEKAVERWRSG